MSELELREYAESMHKDMLTLDAHLDIEVTFLTPENNGEVGYKKFASLQKMDEGWLNGAFFVAYVPQGPLTDDSYRDAYYTIANKIEQIHQSHRNMQDKMGIAYHPQEVYSITNTGKKVAIIAIENGYAIGEDITNVERYYNKGARYITLSHIGHNQICDSNLNPHGKKFLHNGLSAFGRKVIREMNRLGMIIDVAHISKQSVLDVFGLSRAPVLCSHSGIESIGGAGNVWDDDQLDGLQKNGGVIHIVGLNRAIKTDSEEKIIRINTLREEFGFPIDFGSFFGAYCATNEDNRSLYTQRKKEIDKEYPAANVSDLVDHIDYVVSRIGIDHVGISSDFYEDSFCLNGWKDVGENFNITVELVKRCYSKKDIEQIWSGNVLQLWKKIEKTARDKKYI
jgi:microsomal dipeptidase-like Zn-dependent dipeptidase